MKIILYFFFFFCSLLIAVNESHVQISTQNWKSSLIKFSLKKHFQSLGFFFIAKDKLSFCTCFTSKERQTLTSVFIPDSCLGCMTSYIKRKCLHLFTKAALGRYTGLGKRRSGYFSCFSERSAKTRMFLEILKILIYFIIHSLKKSSF